MKALVTGGGGFLGGAIVRRLVARGDDVRSFSRREHPNVEWFRGDLADAKAVARAVEGVDVVFHVAAKAGVWGPYREYHRVNVVGTRNVIDACRANGVRQLVFTSTPSVVFHGEGMEGLDESAPYADRYLAHYPATKAEAERLILGANGDELATVALRPHLIWGPGDNHLVPRIIARAKAGKLRLVSSGETRVDSVYVDNAAEAHVLAADRLPAVAGKVYFISNDEPLPIADLINRILAAADLPPVTRRLPAGVAYAAGWMLEMVYGALGLRREPPMTRFVARQLSTPHWFDLSAAKRDLGYRPSISIDEGMRRLSASLRKRPERIEAVR